LILAAARRGSLTDYSVAGLEGVCFVERKDLNDLVHSFTAERSLFIDRLRRISSYPHRLLVVMAALGQIKSPYPHPGTNPNRICPVPDRTARGFACAFRDHRNHELGEKIVTSYLYQVHLHHWLETNDYGPFLADDDL
jgi:hypothetical protein